MSFFEIIEEIKKFDYEELKELNLITTKYIVEIERDELHNSHLESLNEYNDGKLEFSSEFEKLKSMLV